MPNVPPPIKQHDHVGGAQSARPVDPQRHQLREAKAALDQQEHRQRATPRRSGRGWARIPNRVVSVRTIPSTSSDRPIVAASAPGKVEVAARLALRPSTRQPVAGSRRQQADRDVDEQDPRQPSVV